jgi:hypothetical protein
MKKSFDCVAWMRKRRAEIDEEDRDLTWQEKRRRTHEIASRDPILGSLCRRALTPDELRYAGVREAKAPYESGGKSPDAPANRDD